MTVHNIKLFLTILGVTFIVLALLIDTISRNNGVYKRNENGTAQKRGIICLSIAFLFVAMGFAAITTAFRII